MPMSWPGARTKYFYKTNENPSISVEEVKHTSDNIFGQHFDYSIFSGRSDTGKRHFDTHSTRFEFLNQCTKNHY